MKKPIYVLVTLFNKEDERISDLCTIFDTANREFDSIKLDIYTAFSRWLKHRKPIFASCKILWIHPEKEGIEWSTFGEGYTANSYKLYTEIYRAENNKIILSKDVQ